MHYIIIIIFYNYNKKNKKSSFNYKSIKIGFIGCDKKKEQKNPQNFGDFRFRYFFYNLFLVLVFINII